MIPEIDIWWGANLMLKRYGDKADNESTTRAAQLDAKGILRAPPARCTEKLSTLSPERACHRLCITKH
jgi:hypothetical protein